MIAGFFYYEAVTTLENTQMLKKIAKMAKMNGRMFFFQEFLKHPMQIGSIVPSSRFLEQRVIKAAGASSARVIVELGPGIGGVTRAMLRAMPPDARLLSVEINPHFHTFVDRIEDNRLIAHLGSATELSDILSTYGLEAPDVIVSGIPFSTMPCTVGSQILETVASLLAPNGRFVAYQVKRQVATLCEPYMGVGQTTTELLNIPPMRVFKWIKDVKDAA